MVDTPDANDEGRDHTTGAGRTPAKRVMRSGSEREPARTTRSTEPVRDAKGPMIAREEADEEPPPR